jgi:hypothetical protein
LRPERELEDGVEEHLAGDPLEARDQEPDEDTDGTGEDEDLLRPETDGDQVLAVANREGHPEPDRSHVDRAP